MTPQDQVEPPPAVINDSCNSILEHIAKDLNNLDTFDEIIDEGKFNSFFEKPTSLQIAYLKFNPPVFSGIMIEYLYPDLKFELKGLTIEHAIGEIPRFNNSSLDCKEYIDHERELITYSLLTAYREIKLISQTFPTNTLKERVSAAELMLDGSSKLIKILNSDKICKAPSLFIQKLPVLTLLIDFCEKVQAIDFQLFNKSLTLLTSYILVGLWNRDSRFSIFSQLSISESSSSEAAHIIMSPLHSRLMSLLDFSILQNEMSSEFTDYHSIGIISTGLKLKLCRDTFGTLGKVNPLSLKTLISNYFQSYHEIISLIRKNDQRKPNYSASVQILSGLCSTVIGKESLTAAMIHTGGIEHILNLLESSTTSTRVNGLSSISPVFTLLLQTSLQAFVLYEPKVETYSRIFQLPHYTTKNITTQLEVLFEVIDNSNALKSSAHYIPSLISSLSFLTKLTRVDIGLYELNHAVSVVNPPLSTIAIISYAIYNISCFIFGQAGENGMTFEKAIFDRKIPPVYERNPKKQGPENFPTFSTFSLTNLPKDQVASQRRANLNCCLKLLIFILKRQFTFLFEASLMSAESETEEKKLQLNYGETMLQLVFTSVLIAYRADADTKGLILELFNEIIELSANFLVPLIETLVSLSMESFIYAGFTMKILNSIFASIVNSQSVLLTNDYLSPQLLEQIKPVLFDYLTKYSATVSSDSRELILVLRKIGLSWVDWPEKSLSSNGSALIDSNIQEPSFVPLDFEYYQKFIDNFSKGMSASNEKSLADSSQQIPSVFSKSYDKGGNIPENSASSDNSRNTRYKDNASPKASVSATCNTHENNNVYVDRTGQNRAHISPDVSLSYTGVAPLQHRVSVQEINNRFDKISSGDFPVSPIRRYSSQGQMNFAASFQQPRVIPQLAVFNDAIPSSSRGTSKLSQNINTNPSQEYYTSSSSVGFRPNSFEQHTASAQKWMPPDDSVYQGYSNFPGSYPAAPQISYDNGKPANFNKSNMNPYGSVTDARGYLNTYSGVDSYGAYQ